jgi:hypothetical protein
VTISSGVTPIFWVYCVFVISLVISCAWLLTAPGRPAVPASPWTPSPLGDGNWAPAGPAAETVTDTADTDQPEADVDAADAEPADEARNTGPTPGGAPVDAEAEGGTESGGQSAYA